MKNLQTFWETSGEKSKNLVLGRKNLLANTWEEKPKGGKNQGVGKIEIQIAE